MTRYFVDNYPLILENGDTGVITFQAENRLLGSEPIRINLSEGDFLLSKVDVVWVYPKIFNLQSPDSPISAISLNLDHTYRLP